MTDHWLARQYRWQTHGTRRRHVMTAPSTPSAHRPAQPPVVDRETWLPEREALLGREKAHTREGDAIAAARRRLPMTPVPADATIGGSDGEVPFLEAFEGRSQLI